MRKNQNYEWVAAAIRSIPIVSEVDRAMIAVHFASKLRYSHFNNNNRFNQERFIQACIVNKENKQ